MVAGGVLTACNLGAADPTEPTEGAPETTQTIDSTGTGVTLAPGVTPQTGVTLPPGVTEKEKGRFPWMVEAPGGFVVGEPGAENAVELGDAKEMLERAALSIAYDTRRLPLHGDSRWTTVPLVPRIVSV